MGARAALKTLIASGAGRSADEAESGSVVDVLGCNWGVPLIGCAAGAVLAWRLGFPGVPVFRDGARGAEGRNPRCGIAERQKTSELSVVGRALSANGRRGSVARAQAQGHVNHRQRS